MTLLELLLLLLIAGVCGGIARSLTGYSHGGCLASIVLGFIGALLGMWLARQLKLPEPLPITVGDHTFSVIWSIVGATLFAAVLSFLTRRGPTGE
ncbi:MAG: GlsB/YeaQ/YmgE family stress response membrane protein [Planctomycetia bacterium]|nr:GlsB/YeaQ/YmgE family stress response membrane protein [Planctomycetia bacterium]